jgi:hypothetical protein
MALLTLAEFRTRTIMPAADVDALETAFPGFLQAQIDEWTEEIEDRLRKRYAVPFDASSPPRILKRWLTKLVTRDAYAKRGWDPTSKQDEASILRAAERVEEQLKEAADSEEGLYELPLRASDPAGGVSQGAPLGYSETSPYVFTARQAKTGRAEDDSGNGS